VFQTGTVIASAAGNVTTSFLHLTSYEIPTAGNRFYLSGSFQALDAPGEWYRDPNTSRLYLWTPAGDNPTRHTIEAKHREFAFELSGRSYVNLQGLRIFASSIDTNSSSSHLTLAALNAQYVSHATANPLPWDDSNRGASSGIVIDGSYNVLQNSTIAFSSGNGVYVSGSHSTVQNCVIHDVDYAAGDGAGIHINGSNQLVQGNTIYNAARDGILCTDSSASRFLRNTIHDVMLQTTDGGGIYAHGTDGGGTEIAFNTIYNVRSGGFQAAGVYLDNGSSNFIVHDNAVSNTNFNIKLNPPSYNNTFYNSGPIHGGQTSGISTSWSQSGRVLNFGTFGGWESVGNAVNNSGQVVGQSSTGQSQDAHFFDGRAGHDLGALGGNYSTATAINSKGQVVGTASTASGARHAFLYSGQRMIDLGTLSGDVGSLASGINLAGQVVGTSYDAGGFGSAFVYTGGRMTPVAGLGGSQSAATAINDSGQIAGFSTLADNRNSHAFLTSVSGPARDLGTLGGSSSFALALNNPGQVVGESLIRGDRFFHAFLYSNGRMTDLGTLPNLPNSVATAINRNGDVVGYAYSADYYTSHAFLYRKGVLYDLNNLVPNTGWTFTAANGINDKGQVIGGATNRAGAPREVLLST
jgi:probable HAF family extracellular repeat protein/parallel beta-helix repeat protein